VVLKMQEPGTHYAYVQDPNGIWIELAKFGLVGTEYGDRR